MRERRPAPAPPFRAPHALVLALAACGRPAEPGIVCPEPLQIEVTGDRLLAWSDACGDVELSGRIVGDGALSYRLIRDGWSVTPVVTGGQGGGTLRTFVLEGPYALMGLAPVRLWRQGYQSWSWSGVVDLSEPEIDEAGLPVAGGDGDALDVGRETPWTSWWAGVAGHPDGASLLVGAVSARRTKFHTAFTEDAATAVWGGRGESIAIAEGEQIELDPLRVGLGSDAADLYAAWADVVAEENGITVAEGPPPSGWATWYQFWAEVTEQDVRSNLAVARELDWGEGEPVFQVDDGWAVAWGDWTPNERFPSGMQALAGDIRDAGFVPGLWMAPFYVSRATETYAQHPDWWVRESGGAEIAFSNLGTGDYAVLDVTHPDAAAWLADLVLARRAEGWDYLKFDFLYAGAQEGIRHEDVTGSEAYARGVEILRTSAGDAWVLACGAPLLPTAGNADSYRSGTDIAVPFDPEPNPEFLRWQARQTAARSWSNGRLWWMDADQILVRAPFDTVRARGAITANAVSGGVWLLGDDLPALDDEKLADALSPALLATRGAEGRPSRPLDHASGLDAGPLAERLDPDDTVPVTWRLGERWIALLNTGETATTAMAPPGREVFSGTRARTPTPRLLEPGAGEVWETE